MGLKTLKTGPKLLQPTSPKSVSETQRITGSRWMSRRREVLLNNPTCVECAKQGIVTPATEVDHIMPLWAGGSAVATWNLQGLCREHHKEKSADEAKKRAGG